MPSYYWAGPGYGTYNDDGSMTGFISPDRYMDITVFGNGPGELQAALNIYNEMVSATTSAAQAAANAQQTAQHISDILNDGDPNNDFEAWDLLDANSDISITTPDGEVFNGSNAAAWLRGDPVIDAGVLALITIHANGSAADITQFFNPFAIYHDGYGNDTSVIWNPAQNQYQSFDPSNDNDRAVAASEYSQLAQELRALGRTDQADYCDKIARFFRSTATERATLSPGEWLRKDVGNSMQAPTATETALGDLLMQKMVADLYKEGYNLDAMTDAQVEQILVDEFGRNYLEEYREQNANDPQHRVTIFPDSYINNTSRLGAAVGAIQLTNIWSNALQYGAWVTDMNQQIDALTRRVITETFYQVPLRPNDVNTYVHDHYSLGYTTEEYNRLLLQFQLESEAFWGHP